LSPGENVAFRANDKRRASKTRRGSETFVLCQDKRHSNGPGKMSERESPLRLRPANLSAKKWSTFARVNTARPPRNRRSLSVCRKRVARGWNYRHRNTVRGKWNARHAVNWNQRSGTGNRPAGDRAPRNEDWSASRAGPHPIARCRARHTRLRVGGAHHHVRAPQKKQREHARKEGAVRIGSWQRANKSEPRGETSRRLRARQNGNAPSRTSRRKRAARSESRPPKSRRENVVKRS